MPGKTRTTVPRSKAVHPHIGDTWGALPVRKTNYEQAGPLVSRVEGRTVGEFGPALQYSAVEGGFWIALFAFVSGWTQVLPFYSTVGLPFSNFHEAMFAFRGMDWPSAEHAYQYFKLIFFGARGMASHIARWADTHVTPLECKRMGRLPRGPNGPSPQRKARWEQIKYNLMVQIQKAKFLQNWELGQILISTGDLLLVEASTDRDWGVGYSIENFRLGQVPHPVNVSWGNNKCGECLMQVREVCNKVRIQQALARPWPPTPTSERDLARQRESRRRRHSRRYRARAARRSLLSS